jgi:hypothetical protein
MSIFLEWRLKWNSFINPVLSLFLSVVSAFSHFFVVYTSLLILAAGDIAAWIKMENND